MPPLPKPRKKRINTEMSPDNGPSETASQIRPKIIRFELPKDKCDDRDDRNDGSGPSQTTVIDDGRGDGDDHRECNYSQSSQMIDKELWGDNCDDDSRDAIVDENDDDDEIMKQIEELEKHRNIDDKRIQMNIGDLGSIVSVSLINFMCHENFHIELSPRINFIVGRNGSGKSAILNAIVLGLGGRATTTNRGKNVSTFIRNGASQAIISIKLLNSNGIEGCVGYKIGDYGRHIIIERIINSNGTSTYKVKNDSGKIVCHKKETINDIVRHFHIQVDNPICILNQEVSRNFLNSNKSADKYKFFMKATLLEDLKNTYSEAEEGRVISKNTLYAKKKILPDAEKDLIQTLKKVKLFNRMDDNKKRYETLIKEHLWARVNEKQKNVHQLKLNVETQQKKIHDEQLRLEKDKDMLEETEEERARVAAELEERGTQLMSSVETNENSKKVIQLIKDEERSKKSKMHQLDNERVEVTKDETSVKISLEEQKKNFSNLTENRMQRQTQIEKLTALVNDNQTKLKSISIDVERVRKEMNDVQSSLNNTRDEQKLIMNRINGKSRDLQNLINGQQNRLRRYGPNVPELIKRIDAAANRGEFKVKPLGPIGEYIELPDQSAAFAVERCLKSLIYSFCCDNWDDTKKLQTILAQVYGNERKPSIITRKFSSQQHDVRTHSVVCENYKSMLEIMKIKSPSIANVLIDKLSIESILYIPNYETAVHMLIHNETVPKNCYKAYTEDGNEMYPQTRNNGFRSYAAEPQFRNARILVVNTDIQIRGIKEEIKNLEDKKSDYDNQLMVIENENRIKQQELRGFQNDLKLIKDKIFKDDIELSRLKNIVEPDPVEIQTLEEELNNLKEKKSRISDMINEENEKIQEIRNRMKKAEKEIMLIKTKRDDLLNQKQTIQMKYNDKSIEIDSRKKSIVRREEKLVNLRMDLESEEIKYADANSVLQEDKRLAMEKTGESISTRRTAKSLEKEIEELSKFLTEEANKIGNKEQVIAQYEEMKMRFVKNKSEVETLDRHLKLLKKSLELRRKGYIEWRNYCTVMTKFYFTDVLKLKGFTGSLDIYHREKVMPNGEVKKERTLEVKVNPKVNVKADPSQSSQSRNDKLYNDTRSLSGGERSYSTVAFIIALWQSASCPFKILDEVDVFMDSITRQISLDAMVEFAAQKSGKQYIFLSPLRLQKLPQPELCKVFEMHEPKRGVSQEI